MSTRPEILKKRQESQKRLAFLSFPSKPMPHSILLQFNDYNYNNYIASISKETDAQGKETLSVNENFNLNKQVNIAEISATTSLELPFPRSLQDSQGIRVQSFERDFISERLASGLSSMGNSNTTDFVANMQGAAKDALAGIRDKSSAFFGDPIAAIKAGLAKAGASDPNQATAIASYLAKNIIGGDLARTLSVVGERTVNPQETLSFTGVDLKNYTFTWDLFPSNKKDTEQIQKIVQLLKNKSLPQTEEVAGITSTARAFLKYPSIVTLNLLGVQESHFQRFKRCMISNVTVDYGGGGGMPQIIKGGVPAAVTLSISFSEVQIHVADDYPVGDSTEAAVQAQGGEAQ